MFPINEQSSFSDPNGATPAAPVPSVPDKQQQQTGATETDTCEQTSGIWQGNQRHHHQAVVNLLTKHGEAR